MREHNIQNIAHLSYYTNANGLLLVVYSKLGSAQFSLFVGLRHDPKTHQDPRKGAIRAGDPDMRHPGDIGARDEDAGGPGENRNQTIKCRTKIKESNTTCNTTIPYHPEKESKQSKYR